MLNQVIAVITTVLEHSEDHGKPVNHLIEPLEFINLKPHLSFYSVYKERYGQNRCDHDIMYNGGEMLVTIATR